MNQKMMKTERTPNSRQTAKGKQGKMMMRYVFRGEQREKAASLEKLFLWITNGRYRRAVEAVREDIKATGNMPDGAAVGSEGTDGDIRVMAGGLPVVTVPTGLAVLTLMTTGGQAQLEQLRERVNLMPQTVLSFVCADGLSLQVLMAYVLPDGSLPVGDERAAALFQQYACRRAVDFVWAATGVMGMARTTFQLSWDARAYRNTHVQPVVMEQPTVPLSDKTAAPLPTAPELDRDVLPGYTRLEMDIAKFNAVCRRLAFGRRRPVDEHLVALAAACRRAGIDQEVATKCVLRLGSYGEKEVVVRSTMENAYQHHPLGLYNPLDANLMYQQLMKRFLRRRYQFRRNVVTGDVEFREKDRVLTDWLPMTTEARNDINNAAIDEGIKVWPQDIDRLLASRQVDDYDPVREWLQGLPSWDGRDRLGEMACRVPTTAAGWHDNFKVWMRSMVSQWTSGADGMYGAQMVMMLVGGQGTRKSTFMRMLLPPELRRFYIDRLDFANKKEALRALSRFLLINIDEYDQVSKVQTAYLKHLIQRSDVKERRMFETTYQQAQRYAAFCATTNSLTPLKDESGGRRYMVVEVSDVIDTETGGNHAIDYRQLYAQIVAEINNGEPYFFSGERERMIVEQAADYYETPNVVAMFVDQYRKPLAGDEVLTLSPIEVLNSFWETNHVRVATQSNSVILGNYLRRRGYQKGKGELRRKYLLARIKKG